MNLVCDNPDCKKDFTLNPNALKRRDLGNGITQVFFNCPHCSHEYPVTKVNIEIEEAQKKIDYYANRAAQIKDQKKKNEFLNRMNEWRDKKKKLMNDLNGSV